MSPASPFRASASRTNSLSPSATTVIKLEVDGQGGSVYCERELEGGRRHMARLSLPALVTVQTGINVPRYASLSNVLRVRKLEVPHCKPGKTDAAAGEENLSLFEPDRRSDCEMLEGKAEDVAAALIERIRARVPVL